MERIENLPVVREGVWLYAARVPVRVRVVSSPLTWGTGDYEDEEHVARDQPVPCFLLVYEAAGSPGVFCNIVPNLPSLAEALAHAERIFPRLTWDNP